MEVVSWIKTPAKVNIGPLVIRSEWYYEYDGDTSHLGDLVKQPSEDVYFDRKLGALLGPKVNVKRTFAKREIGLHELDTRPYRSWEYARFQTIEVNPATGKECAVYYNRRTGVKEYETPVKVYGWTDESEANFLKAVNNLLETEEDYPDYICTENEAGDEIEWALLEVFEDGTAQYEADIPELLDNSVSWNMGGYRYVEGFQHLPSNWKDVPEDKRADMIKYCVQDVERLRDYYDGCWGFMWIKVWAEINGSEIASHNMGWIETDSGDEFFMSTYEELKSELLEDVHKELEQKDTRVTQLETAYTEALLALNEYLKAKEEENAGQ